MIKQKFKQGFYSLSGTMFPKAVNLISIPIFIRLMSTGEYGRINVFTTYVTIFSIFLGMDFAVAVGKGTLEFRNQRKEFLSIGVGTTFVFTSIILIISNLWHSFFCDLFHLDVMQLNVLILYAYATFLISFKSMDLIFHMEYAKNFLLNALVAVLGLVCSIGCMLTFFSEDRFMGRVLGAAIPTCIVGFLIFTEIVYSGKRLYDKQIFKFYTHMGIPLIPHSLSQFVLSNADKIMIENMISESKSGIYSFIASLGLLMTALTEAVNNLWNPWMFRRLDEKNETLVKKMVYPYVLLFSAVSILVEGVTPEIIKLLGTKEYYEGLDYCVWMTLTAYLLFLCNKYVDIQYYEKKTYFVSAGTVLAAIINIVLNMFFLKSVGYEFAVISTLVSYTVLIFLYMFVVNVILKRRLINSLFVVVILISMYVIAALLQYFQSNIFMRYGVSGVLALILAFIAFMKIKTSILGSVESK